MRKYFLALLVCLLICARGSPLHAQQGGVLNAAATTTCAAPGNAYVVVPLAQTMGGATLTVTANASGNTISFYASSDAPASAPTNWFALNATPSNSSTAATSTTSTGSWQANVAGYTFVCMEMSTLVSGTSTVRIQPSTASARSGGGGGGSGSVSNQVTDSIPANTNGTATALNAVVCTPPTVNGQYTVGYTVTSSAAVAPTCPLVGLVPDQAAGASVTTADCSSGEIYNPASALGFPTPATLGNPNCFFVMQNNANAVTVTPTTPLNIALNGAAAGTGQAAASLLQHTKCASVVDQVASNQIDINCEDVQGYINGAPFAGTSGHLASFGAGNTPADSGIVAAQLPQQVSSLPATCTNSTSPPVQLTVANGIIGAGVLYYCDSTNHYSPVSQGSGASPTLGLYLSPQCPPSNSANCYYTPANTQQAVDCGWTGTTVTCGSSHFVSADTGKRIYGYTNCAAFQVLNGVTGNAMTGTAAVTLTYVSATSVTVSTSVAHTQTGTTSCIIWGTPDDTGAAAIDTVLAGGLATLSYCPAIHLAAANYMFTTPHFYTNPQACINQPAQEGNSPGLGNVFYSAGLELSGRGMGATIIFVTPGFPETGACTHGQASSAHACFVIPLEGRWSDFQMNGGFNQTAVTGTSYLIQMDAPASLERFMCLNWAPNAANVYGLDLVSWAQLQQVEIAGCGTIGATTDSSNFSYGATTAFRLRIENEQAAALYVNTQDPPVGGGDQGYAFTCYDCNFALGPSINSPSETVGNADGGTIDLYSSVITDYGYNGNVGYEAVNTNGGTLRMHDGKIRMNHLTTASAIICNTVTCTNYLQNTALYGGATGNIYQDEVAGSKLFDQGGNLWVSGAWTLTGQVFGETNSANTSNLVTGNLVLSAGWGSTATKTAFVGGDFPAQFTITNSGTGQGATPTITYTFPVPLPTAPISCTATDLSGTNPLLNPFTTSALSRTGATFTATGTPTVSDTEVMQITCVTP